MIINEYVELVEDQLISSGMGFEPELEMAYFDLMNEMESANVGFNTSMFMFEESILTELSVSVTIKGRITGFFSWVKKIFDALINFIKKVLRVPIKMRNKFDFDMDDWIDKNELDDLKAHGKKFDPLTMFRISRVIVALNGFLEDAKRLKFSKMVTEKAVGNAAVTLNKFFSGLKVETWAAQMVELTTWLKQTGDLVGGNSTGGTDDYGADDRISSVVKNGIENMTHLKDTFNGATVVKNLESTIEEIFKELMTAFSPFAIVDKSVASRMIDDAFSKIPESFEDNVSTVVPIMASAVSNVFTNLNSYMNKQFEKESIGPQDYVISYEGFKKLVKALNDNSEAFLQIRDAGKKAISETVEKEATICQKFLERMTPKNPEKADAELSSNISRIYGYLSRSGHSGYGENDAKEFMNIVKMSMNVCKFMLETNVKVLANATMGMYSVCNNYTRMLHDAVQQAHAEYKVAVGDLDRIKG